MNPILSFIILSPSVSATRRPVAMGGTPTHPLRNTRLATRRRNASYEERPRPRPDDKDRVEVARAHTVC